jgi:ABC transporter substrate binding protein
MPAPDADIVDIVKGESLRCEGCELRERTHGIEGRTVAIEYRWADGRSDRYDEIAAEFVRLKVDVIVTTGPAAQQARRATSVIPIVLPLSGDPVGVGLAASLARPGGNVTGLSIMQPELASKRLELLREVVYLRAYWLFPAAYSNSSLMRSRCFWLRVTMPSDRLGSVRMNSNAASTITLASIGLVPALYRPATARNSMPIRAIDSVAEGKDDQIIIVDQPVGEFDQARMSRPVIQRRRRAGRKVALAISKIDSLRTVSSSSVT